MLFKLLTLAIVLTACHGFIFFDNHGNSVNEVVNTTCGEIKGHWNSSDRAYIFAGIPYASPPVGQLRWKPPVPLSKSNGNCWTGELSATSFGNQCVQPSNTNLSVTTGNENCLFLNVWTPSIDNKSSLPVMVWIHGGNLVYSNGNDDAYAPSSRLVRETNTVYVSMNYRLNAFGFLALDILAPLSPTNTSGNYGFMDQITALRWVQENIRQFGGDPNKVTVFGHSSGGTSVYALLGSPLTKGLFQKAWMASASPILNKTATDAFEDNKVFLKNSGCRDVDCLYNLSSLEIINAIPWDEYPFWSMNDLVNLPTKGKFVGALAIVDGYVLPESPLEAWVHGIGQDVPLMIGTTAQENDFGVYPDEEYWFNWTLNRNYDSNVKNFLSTFDDVVAETALKLYPKFENTPAFQYSTMSSDARVICATDYLSLIAAESFSSPVYRYVSTFTPTYPRSNGNRSGYFAFHGIDIMAFFDTMDHYFNETTLHEKKYTKNIQNEVISFVKIGNPSTLSWRPYPLDTALIKDVSQVTNGYHTAECQFWLRNGFFSYAWIN